jgi:hypothetical protein
MSLLELITALSDLSNEAQPETLFVNRRVSQASALSELPKKSRFTG